MSILDLLDNRVASLLPIAHEHIDMPQWLIERMSTDEVFGLGVQNSLSSWMDDSIAKRFRLAVWPVPARVAEASGESRKQHPPRYFACNLTMGTPAPFEHEQGGRLYFPYPFECTAWDIRALGTVTDKELVQLLKTHMQALVDFVIATLTASERASA